MRVVHRTPAGTLGGFVRLWSCEATELDGDDVLECSLPHGEVAVFVNLDEDELRWYERASPHVCHRGPGATLTGPRTRAYLIDTREQRRVVGATFAVGAARPFFAMPIDALSEQYHLPLDAVWGHAGRGLRDRLLEAPTAESRLEVLERALAEQQVRALTRDPTIDLAIARLTDRERPWSVGAVQRALGLSATRFIRAFAAHVGLTPKRYARLHRVGRALAELDRGRRTRGGLAADVAATCGYADQAHLIHEIRAFTGATPSELCAGLAPVRHRRVDREKPTSSPPRPGAS